MIIRKTIIKKKMKKEKKMKRSYEFCGCWGVRGFKDAWLDMFGLERKKNGERSGEVFELIKAVMDKELKEKDYKKYKKEVLGELSDMCWCIGKLIGGLLNKEYVKICGDERHYVKVVERMEEDGCIRSKENKSYCGRK